MHTSKTQENKFPLQQLQEGKSTAACIREPLIKGSHIPPWN